MSNLHAYTGVLTNDSIWYSAMELNSLYRFDLEKHTNEFVCLFSGEKSFQKEIHKICVTVGNFMVFLPFRGRHIHIYNSNVSSMVSILFEEYVYDAFTLEGDVWMVCGENGEKLYILNILDKEISCVEEYENAYKSVGKQGGRRFKYYNGHIWFGCLGTNKIADWDIQEKELSIHSTDIKNIFAICPTNTACWVIDRDTPNIYEWNYRDETVVHNIDDLYISADAKELPYSPRFYNNIFCFKDRIVLLPAFTDYVSIYDGKEIKKQRIEVPERAKNLPKCFGYVSSNKGVYLIPFCTDKLICISETLDIRIDSSFPNMPNSLSWKEKHTVMEESIKEKGYVDESELLGLKDFLSVI